MFRMKFIAAVLLVVFTTSVKAHDEQLLMRSFANGKIQLLIPSDFKALSPDMLESKYPHGQHKPQNVLSNYDATVNIIVDFLPQALDESQIEEAKNKQVKIFKETFPAANWRGDGIQIINGKKIGYFKFIAPAEYVNIYNYFFFTSVDGKLLLCTFNCTIVDMPEWEAVAEQIVQSLKIN